MRWQDLNITFVCLESGRTYGKMYWAQNVFYIFSLLTLFQNVFSSIKYLGICEGLTLEKRAKRHIGLHVIFVLF
jgi:hypothetical protein